MMVKVLLDRHIHKPDCGFVTGQDPTEVLKMPKDAQHTVAGVLYRWIITCQAVFIQVRIFHRG